MFEKAEVFNQDIGDWNVSAVTDMFRMFSVAQQFDQDIGDWDVSAVTDMNFMFYRAGVFDQDLSDWCGGDGVIAETTFSYTSCAADNCGVDSLATGDCG